MQEEEKRTQVDGEVGRTLDMGSCASSSEGGKHGAGEKAVRACCTRCQVGRLPRLIGVAQG